MTTDQERYDNEEPLTGRPGAPLPQAGSWRMGSPHTIDESMEAAQRAKKRLSERRTAPNGPDGTTSTEGQD